MGELLVPAREMRMETRVGGSRFVTTIAPVFSLEEARGFIQRIRQEFPDATHHVPAYLIGHGRSCLAHCGDDGEPSGTAGRPALAVLQGSGLGDVAVVVTRYFGGSKLGRGGLVRAYTQAVQNLLAELPLATKVATQTIKITVPYEDLQRLRSLLARHAGRILKEDFAEQVDVTARVSVDQMHAFQGELLESSGGMLQAEVLETHGETIMPRPRDP